MGGGENEDMMGPDGKADGKVVSFSVFTVHAIEPCCDGPIVSPLRVIVVTTVWSMVPPVTVSTMEVAVGAAQVAVGLLLDVPLIAAVGVADVAKKLVG